MPSAPYVVGQWVRGEKFYGRASQIDEILEGHRNWIWLLGTRRVGKTSLLKQIEWLTSQGDRGDYFPVFWDFQGAEDADELRRGFAEALFDAEERLDAVGIALSEVEGADLFESLNKLRRKVRGKGRRLLLLCDEVEELIKLNRRDPSLLRKLRRAVQSQEDIRTVMASTIRLWELSQQEGDTSPFLHGFAPPLYIERLTDEEALALIRQANLPSSSRPAVSDEAAEGIRSRCDNHPYLIQLVSKRCVEEGNLDDAVEEVASDGMVSHFFSVDFDMLSVQERDILRVVAESSAANSASIEDRLGRPSGDVGPGLQRLERLGYVRRNAGRRYELANFFFRRWFTERAGLVSRDPFLYGDDPRTTEETQVDSTGPEMLDRRYRLLEPIGTGATGTVFRAEDEVVREVLALKILHPGYCRHADALERVRKEILLTRDLNHPNIVRIYHLGNEDGRWYLTMKWVAGTTLAEQIARDGALPIPRVLDVSRKLASALDAAHGRRVLHRDVKPHNILLDERGEPYLTDFGLARLLGAPSTTQSGVFVGTPDYASPEQASLLPLDERSDLYALGVVMFEMATGRRPFGGETVSEVLEKHRNAPPPDPRALRPDVPVELSRVILRCLEKPPAKRFQTARELGEALRR